MEISSFCAVDGFALISGYMAQDRPPKYSKLAGMWLQVFFYSFIVSIILMPFGLGGKLTLKEVAKMLLPVTSSYFWYFTAYVAAFFAAPLLNKSLFSLEESAAKKALILLVTLFSVLELIADPFKVSGGYSALWLIVLYCVGVLAKRVGLFEKRKSVTLILLWLLCLFGTWALKVFAGIDRIVSYVSPPILMSGMLLVILFSRLRLKGTVIAKLSPLAFGIYLFQLNHCIWNGVLKGAFTFVLAENLAVAVGLVFLLAFAIFAAGLLVEFVRAKLASALRIPKLCDAIVKITSGAMQKLSVLLR